MSNDRTHLLGFDPARSSASTVMETFARGLARSWRSILPALILALAADIPLAHAGTCPGPQPFFKLPEIVAQSVELPNKKRIEILRGTLELTDTQVLMMTRLPATGSNGVAPGTPGAVYDCSPQTVRAFRVVPEQPLPPAAGQTLPDPFPGPVLRARVGDLVQLTFVNQVDPARFPRTAEASGSASCDVILGSQPGQTFYPGSGANADRYPDCFHGSSTGNIHFHGTHTNPNGTGDNVLLEVRPSPRDANNKPTITPDTYKKVFDKFFAECAEHLVGNPREEWPRNWNGANDPGGSSLGPWLQRGSWTYNQMELLSDSDTGANWKVAMKNGWPQYYIGAYPYCFQLPFSTASSFPPPPGTLQMGQAPGTHWYHAHKHGSTAIDVANGMVGAFIIEGPSYDDQLNMFYGPGWTRTQPVMVINQPGSSPNKMRPGGASSQDKGPDFVVNGRFQSIIDMAPGEVQMWRIVNGAGRSGVFIQALPDGFRFRQIAQDGVQFADNNYQRSENKSLLIASGNRADLLVMAPTAPGVYPLMVQHDVDPSDLTGTNPAIKVVLLQIRVNKDLPPVTGNRLQFIPAMPKPPAFLDNITTPEANSERRSPPGCIPLNPQSTSPCGTANNPRVVRFASTGPGQGGQHTIDGRKFNENPDDAKKVTLNTVEEWQIENATLGISHPFHIHINPFQIVEVFDPNQKVQSTNGHGVVFKYVSKAEMVDPSVQCEINPDGSKADSCPKTVVDDSVARIWWDVFPIPSGRNVTFKIDGIDKKILVAGHFRMRSRFVDFPGEYVIHCHILAHEDRGMMALVEVKAPTAPSFLGMLHHH